jgi:hypothetical protein
VEGFLLSGRRNESLRYPVKWLPHEIFRITNQLFSPGKEYPQKHKDAGEIPWYPGFSYNGIQYHLPLYNGRRGA